MPTELLGIVTAVTVAWWIGVRTTWGFLTAWYLTAEIMVLFAAGNGRACILALGIGGSAGVYVVDCCLPALHSRISKLASIDGLGRHELSGIQDLRIPTPCGSPVQEVCTDDRRHTG